MEENIIKINETVDLISTDDYIKATIDAGNRVKQIIYFLCFATIISFIAFWNEYQGSWINKRFDTIYEAVGGSGFQL